MSRPIGDKNDIEMLPIDLAAMSDNENNELEMYVPLLASVGMKYEVGGVDSRGGLTL